MGVVEPQMEGMMGVIGLIAYISTLINENYNISRDEGEAGDRRLQETVCADFAEGRLWVS